MAVSNNAQSSIDLNNSISKSNDRGGGGGLAKLVNTLNPKLLNQGLNRVASISRGETLAGIDMPRTAESPTRLAPR